MERSRQIKFGVIFSVVLIAGLRLGTSSAQEELDSLKVCKDTQTLVVENAFVRVIDDKIPVGAMEPKHRHTHGVTVALTDYDIEQTNYPSGKKIHAHRSFGEVNWGEPVIHDVKNVGTTPSHAIRIELK